MERITVVKIGGNVIDNPAAMKRFLKEFAALEGPKILVHGGGKLATRLAERLELKVQMVDGRRITDKGTLDVVTMVYAGLINKQAVAGLQAAGCNALGLSGADGNAVTARRRSPQPVDYGFVGDIERVDSALLRRLARRRHGARLLGHHARRERDPAELQRRQRGFGRSAGRGGNRPDRPGFLLRESRGSAQPGRRHVADPRDHGRNLSAAQGRRRREQRDDPQDRKRPESRRKRGAERDDPKLRKPVERNRNGDPEFIIHN